MEARDGLVVRLRLHAGRLTPELARALAALVDEHAGGLELSSRGNLQMRGVPQPSYPALIEALAGLCLLDGSADIEASRNLLVSPLAGHDGGDAAAVLATLDEMFRADPAVTALPAKILWLVDDGSMPSLAGIAADIRFEWTGTCFSIGLGGIRDTAVRLAPCSADEVGGVARCLAQALVALFQQHADLRRSAPLVARIGPAALAAACSRHLMPALAPRPVTAPSHVCGARRFGGRPVVGAAAPFGRLTASMLRALAHVARDELRLTPWRTVLLPDVRADARGLRELAAVGLIVEPTDPRLFVSACVGRAGCLQATTDTLADAEALAAFAFPSRTIHVSGCPKGCAQAGAAAVTLVGREGRYDLVREGSARDAPIRFGLDRSEVQAELEFA